MKRFVRVISIIAVAALAVLVWVRIHNYDKASKEPLELEFQDVQRDDWYYGYLTTAYNRGWVRGTSSTRFTPDAPMKRGEFALALYRYLKKPDVSGFSNPFVDVEGLDCEDAVMYLNELKLLTGKDETHFAPEQVITREQLVTILYRLGGYKVHEEFSPSGKFSDRDQISPWAQEAVDWAVENQFLEGSTETVLDPQAPATRAQAVKILCLYGEKADYKTETADPGKLITLKVWQAGIDDSKIALAMNGLLNRFEERNPNITVEYTPIPTSEKPYERIAEALENGNGPDVLLVSSPYDMVLADQGLILPLDTLLAQSVVEDIQPGLMIDCSYVRDVNSALRGRLVSAPLFATPRALLINRSLFDHFGVAYPDNDFSYDKMLSAAEAMKGSRDGLLTYGIGTRASSPALYLGMIWSTGATIVDPNTGLASTHTPQWEKVTEQYLELYTTERSADRSVSMDYNSQLGMFAKGSVAMIDASLDAARLIRGQDGWGDNLAVYPYLDNAQPACAAVGEVAVIPADTEYIVNAAELINFLMESDSQIAYAERVGYFPGVMSALDGLELLQDPYLAPYVFGIEDTERLGDHGHEIYALIRDELKQVLNKEQTVQDYCAELEAKINTILQRKDE
ncbi:MAG: extracellular solute-binding protein [Oscillospiraceae bacterium]|nr:extracellular solute-binding protein [Oscillospiraceae bacterium]